jgi:hypothetical protein
VPIKIESKTATNKIPIIKIVIGLRSVNNWLIVSVVDATKLLGKARIVSIRSRFEIKKPTHNGSRSQ